MLEQVLGDHAGIGSANRQVGAPMSQSPRLGLEEVPHKNLG